MRITLVMPGVGRKAGEGYVRSWTMEPLGLAVLAAATPPDVDVTLVDDRLEAIPYDTPTDAVCLNVETYTARRAYAIAAMFRERGVPVILGGYHPSLLPEEAVRYADAVVEGHAEAVWPQVLSDLRAGQLKRRYRAESSEVIRGLFPRRDLLAGRKYLPVTLVESGRGCCFGCEFCSVSRFYQRTIHPRPIEDVVEELARAGRRTAFFVDDNIVADRARAKELFSALAPMGIRWISQGSITMADDPAFLKSMRESGCQGVLIGFESLSAKTLAAMGKGWNQASRDYTTAISRIRDAGIPIYATFVFGYDTDDADCFERTLEFAIRQKFFLAAFNHLVPFPGTPLYSRLQSEGRLRFDRWWLDAGYRFGEVAFRPRGMSAEELARRCYETRVEFFRWNSILARAWDTRSNLRDWRTAALYLWVNVFSGGEARQRQGLALGAGFDDATIEALEPLAEPPPEVVGMTSAERTSV